MRSQPSSPSDVTALIQRIARGGTGVGPALLSRLACGIPEANLTRREQGVLALVLAGWRNRRIAAAFDLGEQTVRNYTSRIYGKIGVTSRVEALVWARGHGCGREP